jgi:hypothetical protein
MKLVTSLRASAEIRQSSTVEFYYSLIRCAVVSATQPTFANFCIPNGQFLFDSLSHWFLDKSSAQGCGDMRRAAASYHVERLESREALILVHLRAPAVTCKAMDRKKASTTAAQSSCCG